MKFTGRLDDDKNTPDEILTVKRLKETYDLRHTEVVRIAAYFCCGDYQGQLLVIKEGIDGKNRMG